MVFLTLPYMTSNFENSHTQPSMFQTLMHQQPKYHHKDTTSSKLTWELYNQYCHQPAWEHVNKVTTQLRCSQLDGTIVKWQGIITNIEIGRVFNTKADLIYNYLPAFWAEMIACWYGERNKIACSPHEQCDDIKAFLDEQKRCNLNNWNTYEYDITVRMNAGILSSPTEVTIKAQHQFGNFTLRLNNSDRIWFKGMLKNYRETTMIGKEKTSYMSLGKLKPIVNLQAIGCVNCKAGNIETVQVIDNGLTVNSRVKDLYRGVKYLLNVLFNPLVTFK